MSESPVEQSDQPQNGQEYFYTPVPKRAFTELTAKKSRGRKRLDRIPHELDKKHENARQSILRYFKKTMRKLAKVCSGPAKRQKTFLQAQKLFHSIYPLGSAEDFDQITELLRRIPRNGVLRSNIKAKGFKSCCNAYVEWLFSSPVVKDLYRLHTSLAAAAGAIDDILRLPRDTTEAQRSKVIQFAWDIPDN